jgi:hypothetical protein
MSDELQNIKEEAIIRTDKEFSRSVYLRNENRIRDLLITLRK